MLLWELAHKIRETLSSGSWDQQQESRAAAGIQRIEDKPLFVFHIRTLVPREFLSYKFVLILLYVCCWDKSVKGCVWRWERIKGSRVWAPAGRILLRERCFVWLYWFNIIQKFSLKLVCRVRVFGSGFCPEHNSYKFSCIRWILAYANLDA